MNTNNKIIFSEKIEFVGIEKIEAIIHIIHTNAGLFRRVNEVWEKFGGNGYIEQWGVNRELDELFQAFIKDHTLDETESEKIRKLDEVRLAELESLLELIPQCPVHGRCIPWAKEWLHQMGGKAGKNLEEL